MTEILARAEWPEPVFSAADVADWPRATRKRLVQLELLARTSPAQSFPCDACGFDHVEPVEWVRLAGLTPRVCIRCADAGLVWLEPAVLDRWLVRLPVLAQLVAAALGTAGTVADRVPGRVWKLGTVRVGCRVWIGHLAVGLNRSDAAAVLDQVPELRAPNALLFVPTVPPAETVWLADRVPTVVPLCDFLTLGPNGLVVDRDALASSLPSANRSSAKGPARVFATPPGTAWEQIALTIEDLALIVRVGDRVERFGFAEAGFENRRKKGTPDDLWTLLSILARHRGVLGTGDQIATKSGKLKQKMSKLRERLGALLALDDDPFHPNKKNQPYRTHFTIRSAGPTTFKTPPGAAWGDITLTETETGLVEVAVTTEGRGVVRVRGDGPGDPGRWEGTTEPGERRHRHTLAELGLAGPDGKLTAAGNALVAILRAGGRLARPADDDGMLALGGALTRFLQLAGPPFEFDKKSKRWVAWFEAMSDLTSSDR